MSRSHEPLSACGCCEGISRLTPVVHYNRPGLPELAFRVGTHGRFKSTMLAEIARQKNLRRLGTRRDDDLTVGLIDSWSLVLDVLSFYQERIANEGYLSSATERRSLLELARLIGYELGPGVAASVLLSFILDQGPGAPERITIAAGTRAQSLPSSQDEVPESFETSQDLVAEARWNELHPRKTTEQIVSAASFSFFFAGLATGLKKGDPLLRVTDDNGDVVPVLLHVVDVEPQAELGRTLVICEGATGPPWTNNLFIQIGWSGSSDSPLDALLGAEEYVDSAHLMVTSEEESFTTGELIAILYSGYTLAPISSLDPAEPGLYALRVSSPPFGHNAPLYGTLTDDMQAAFGAFTEDANDDAATAQQKLLGWDRSSGWPISESPIFPVGSGNRQAVHLAQAFDEVIKGSWVVLDSGGTSQAFRAASATKAALADFALSGTTTRLTLVDPESTPVDYEVLGNDFKLRNTVIHTASERLELAELPVELLPSLDETANAIVLEELVPHLEPGRSIILEGERSDLPGLIDREELVVDHVEQGARTKLVFTKDIQHKYVRATVKFYANVVPATHGETATEVLGSGDSSLPYQRFELRRHPLTYVSAPVPSGGESTLEVEVDGVKWREAPSLFGLEPEDRAYALRRDDDGLTSVLFGDGEKGSRPPTGAENVVARYRAGIGQAGMVDRDAISLLATRPLGVKGVTNPLAAGGAKDPETRDEARLNAPLTVLTLDRVVSLQDYQDFARAFAGVGKARADWVWDGSQRVIHVTVAGTGGTDPAPVVLDNLRTAMDAARDPFQPLILSPFVRYRFRLAAKLLVDQAYDWDRVAAEVEEVLISAFSFDARDFAQRVPASEVVAGMQRVEGVVAVDLDELAELTGSVTADDNGLPARPARYDAVTGEILAAELMILGSPTAEPIQLTRIP